MKKAVLIFCLILSVAAWSQRRPYSQQMADAALSSKLDSLFFLLDRKADASGDMLLLRGFEEVWKATGNGKYFSYINKVVDSALIPDGNLKSADQVNPALGYQLLLLYDVTKKDRYRKAAKEVFDAVAPTKQIIDPGATQVKAELLTAIFLVQYNILIHQDTTYVLLRSLMKDVAKHTLTTADLPIVGFTILEIMDRLPRHHPIEQELQERLNSYAKTIVALQDSPTGRWSVPAAAPSVELATTSLAAYTIARSVRMGYIDSSFLKNAKQGYEYVMTSMRGAKGTSSRGIAGKATDPKTVKDDFMGNPEKMGSFILLAGEMEQLETRATNAGKKVVLDYYYNNEWQKDATGIEVRYHYTWADKSNSGYSTLGNIFEANGAVITHFDSSAALLGKQNAGVYIIVDPDTEKETASPHFLQSPDIDHIKDWVQSGGVLVLLGNDKGNAEFIHLNQLSSQFGIRFNEDKQNTVVDDQYEQGVVMTGSNSMFPKQRKLFIKEFSSLQLQSPARSVLEKNGVVVMAEASFGKGHVIAVGDPWIYNEYVDGRKLPPDFENYAAAVDWVKYILAKTKASVK